MLPLKVIYYERYSLIVFNIFRVRGEKSRIWMHRTHRVSTTPSNIKYFSRRPVIILYFGVILSRSNITIVDISVHLENTIILTHVLAAKVLRWTRVAVQKAARHYKYVCEHAQMSSPVGHVSCRTIHFPAARGRPFHCHAVYIPLSQYKSKRNWSRLYVWIITYYPAYFFFLFPDLRGFM